MYEFASVPFSQEKKKENNQLSQSDDQTREF